MDGKWHDVTGGSDTELSGTPDDVTITWGDTNSSATDGVIRLDDINKGLTPDDNNNKTTSVKVTSTVKDTNGEYQSASTGDITLTKKQLTDVYKRQGTTVTVDYGNTNTEVYTSDDGVNWKKNNTAVSEKPFTITLPTDKDSLAVGTATVSVKVKDGVEDSVSRTVNKRKVTVTPAKNGDVTKVYNGNTTYTNGVIEWTVRSCLLYTSRCV